MTHRQKIDWILAYCYHYFDETGDPYLLNGIYAIPENESTLVKMMSSFTFVQLDFCYYVLVLQLDEFYELDFSSSQDGVHPGVSQVY